jgi:hypothetical protein
MVGISTILGIDFLFVFFLCFFLDEYESWMCYCIGFGECALWSLKTRSMSKAKKDVEHW